MPFTNLAAIRRANKQAGQYWFEPDTMSFFESYVDDPVIAGRFFISTERGPYSERKASIRVALDNGSIETVGEFNSYDTVDEARAALDEALAEGVRIESPPDVPEDHYLHAVLLGSLRVTETTLESARGVAAQIEAGLPEGG